MIQQVEKMDEMVQTGHEDDELCFFHSYLCLP